MTRLNLTYDRDKLIATIHVDDVQTDRQRFDPLNVNAQNKLCKVLKIDKPSLLAWINSVPAHGQMDFTVPDKKALAGGLTVFRRKMDAPSVDAIAFPNLEAALDGSTVDDVLEWESKEQLCGLDIDYHGTTPPPADWLTGVCEVHLKSKPFLWHFSRGGGLHLFYRALGDLTAEELAGIAALRFKQLDPTAGVECKKQFRGWSGELFRMSDAQTVTSVTEWVEYEGVEEKQITDWLESEGMEIGQRYPHERCPINPCTSHAEPVQVMDTGIFCHRCAGLGNSIGSRKPGWAPWGSLVGSRGCGLLGLMIRHLTHWGHAKWVVKDRFRVDDYIGRLAYRAACKLYHSGKPSAGLVNKIFCDEAESFARVGGRWASVESDYEWTKDCVGILGSLPVCNQVNEEGVAKSVASRLNLFQQPTLNLSSFGYSDLEVIRGCKVYGQHLEYRQPGRLVIEVPHKREARYGKQFSPLYIPAGKRLSESAAKSVFDSVLPGIIWPYVYLLIAAKGCREGPVGLNPVLLVDGPTGSAKSGHVQLAVGMCGDNALDVVYTTDTEKLRQSIKRAAVSGSYAVVNEFIKEATHGRDRLTPVQALDPILNLTPNSVSKEMYVGPVMMGQPPVLVFTEQSIPQTLRAQGQIARRCHHVRMPERVDWATPLTALGLSSLEDLRCSSDELRDASNAILSYVIDQFFQVPTSFDTIAKELGYFSLESSPDFDDPTSQLLDFFVEVCRAPDIEAPHKKRFSGKGYKLIEKSDESELHTLWSMLADKQAGPDWFQSRQIMEKDWGKVIGSSAPVRSDIINDGQRVAVRFSQGPVKSPVAVNGEIEMSGELRERLK